MKKNQIIGLIIGLVIILIFGIQTWKNQPGNESAPPPSPSPTTPVTFTREEVATHNTEASCYTIVGSNVYDLTLWIKNHPGGPQAILSICGVDGTQAFSQQHGASDAARAELATHVIGTVTN